MSAYAYDPIAFPNTNTTQPNTQRTEKQNLNQAILAEIQRYLILPSVKIDDKNIMTWWNEREQDFPILSEVAFFVLASPSASAAAERKFSIAGQILSPRRSRLMPDRLDAMLVLGSNIDYLNKKM